MPPIATFVGSYNDVRRIPPENLPQIAFAGRSNVGKSTLLNKLVGRKKLAKTSKTPGRTQMLNFFVIDEKYFFVDLPGYGYAKAPPQVKKKWGILVDEYLEKSANLKGLIFLLDCRRDPNADDLLLLQWVKRRELDYVIALTKADKLSKNNQKKKVAEIKAAFKIEPILFSGKTGFGKHELWRWISKITG